jgi:hypothetical protein
LDTERTPPVRRPASKEARWFEVVMSLSMPRLFDTAAALFCGGFTGERRCVGVGVYNGTMGGKRGAVE